MPIQFSCPTCGKSLKAPETSVGQTVKCPYCQTHLEVPEPVVEAAPAEAVPDDPAAPSAPGAAPAADDRCPCPACGEMIKPEAVKCRFCGEVFDETLRRLDDTKHHPRNVNLTAAEWLVAILCANIGCIVSIIWMIQGKPKGTKMFLVSLCAQVGWAVVGFLIGLTQQGH